jgi:hypothetical protein
MFRFASYQGRNFRTSLGRRLYSFADAILFELFLTFAGTILLELFLIPVSRCASAGLQVSLQKAPFPPPRSPQLCSYDTVLGGFRTTRLPFLSLSEPLVEVSTQQ